MKFDVYSAFGNQIRTKLILCLSNKPKNVTELIQSCNLSQSAISQHLSKLKKAGIAKSTKLGQTVLYSLKQPKAAKISALLLELEEELKINKI